MDQITDKRIGDIDIDFSNRNLALSFLEHTKASIVKNNKLEKHNTGVYFHVVPKDPVTDLASLDYETAEKNGWYKLDLLNVWVYEQIRNEEHLIDLTNRELDWNLFLYKEFTEKLIHIGNYYQLVQDLKPKSIEDLAIILALIRPGKRHLTNKCKLNGFNSIKDEIWVLDNDDKYSFRKSHSMSYAMLVYVHANLIIEQTIQNI